MPPEDMRAGTSIPTDSWADSEAGDTCSVAEGAGEMVGWPQEDRAKCIWQLFSFVLPPMCQVCTLTPKKKKKVKLHSAKKWCQVLTLVHQMQKPVFQLITSQQSLSVHKPHSHTQSLQLAFQALFLNAKSQLKLPKHSKKDSIKYIVRKKKKNYPQKKQ